MQTPMESDHDFATFTITIQRWQIARVADQFY